VGPLSELASATAEDTISVGLRIGRSCRRGVVIALEGPLGSGKTTLVKGLARALEVEEPITSPTFTLISQYRGLLEGRPVDLFHVDLYRLVHERELEDLGLEELMGGQGITVIEWGEKAASLLPEDAVRVAIELAPDGTRRIRVAGLEI
jgi:tRNA threonylcarbamoyladenosine biosynthesis protein TsaE